MSHSNSISLDLLEFEQVKTLAGRTKIAGVTSLRHLVPGHGLLIKESKYLKQVLAFVQDSKASKYPLVLLFSTKIWETLDKTQKDLFQNSFEGVIHSGDLDYLVCKISEFFYLSKYRDLNNVVDGRQMGSVEIHPSADIAQNVFIGDNVLIEKDVKIYPGVKILSHSKVGEGTILFPNVSIYPFVHVGKNCRIHSQTVIGADGFGYFFHNGRHEKIWHYGGVHIGNDVEIGASSCVDSGTYWPTEIGDGTKIDNQVQVAHNCVIGKNVIICGQSAVAGSTTVGDYTVFGGKSGTGHGLTIGAQCEIAGGALVNCDWPEKSKIAGHPARPLREWLKGIAYLRKESLKK